MIFTESATTVSSGFTFRNRSCFFGPLLQRATEPEPLLGGLPIGGRFTKIRISSLRRVRVERLTGLHRDRFHLCLQALSPSNACHHLAAMRHRNKAVFLEAAQVNGIVVRPPNDVKAVVSPYTPKL